MTVLTAFAPSLVAAVSVFIVGWLSKGRFDSMGEKIDGVRNELTGAVDGLRGEIGAVRDDVRQVRGELAGLRSDLTHVALAVGAKPRPETA